MPKKPLRIPTRSPTQPIPEIRVIKIRMTNKLMEEEVGWVCDLLQENWEESVGLPYPKKYPEVTRDHYLVMPLIKRVIEDFLVRCDDTIAINQDNLAGMGFAADNDPAGQRRLNQEVIERKELIKSIRAVKRAVISATKRR